MHLHQRWPSLLFPVHMKVVSVDGECSDMAGRGLGTPAFAAGNTVYALSGVDLVDRELEAVDMTAGADCASTSGAPATADCYRLVASCNPICYLSAALSRFRICREIGWKYKNMTSSSLTDSRAMQQVRHASHILAFVHRYHQCTHWLCAGSKGFVSEPVWVWCQTLPGIGSEDLSQHERNRHDPSYTS